MGVISLKRRHSIWLLRRQGLRPRFVQLENGCTFHCWVPENKSEISSCNKRKISEINENMKPALLLLHGFGAEGTTAWDLQVTAFAKDFQLFIPDLLFFGSSTTTNKQRSEIFQAESLVIMMKHLGVESAAVLGHSYGGFVAFRMADLFPSFVTRLIIISSGIMMSSTTNEKLLQEFSAANISEVLLPISIANARKFMKLVFNKLPSWFPDYIFKEILQILNQHRSERIKLLDALVIGKEGSPQLPKLSQEVCILWGEEDKIFNVKLAHELKDFLGSNAQLQIVKGASHSPHVENAKTVNELLRHALKSEKL
ncbi:hypothetical protein KP509_07G032600 [Ceratopteris richardii]|uniref:AB hydrolase-1 domain-containing protein n=1 Tax=Ceratopteris richardii TaxID=49495 RepID=A0A8T2UGM2_CERRI|nr:hypothetical protein KP509_07G032600 [Ceratopteris richardii]